jgi:DNA-binding CsgD family transcriptional regulator/tetratricopeptide (TPR) repeat protein
VLPVPDQDRDTRAGREISDQAAEGRPIGREVPLASLIDSFKIALGGTGRTCLVTGEAGVGKTRLMQELLERAQAYDCHILSGKAQEYDHGIANASLRDVLASARYDDFDETSRAEFTSLLATLDAAVRGDNGDARHAQHAQPAYLFTKALSSLCQHRPTVVALDDAHLSDDETLVALSFAARRLSQLPLLLVVSTRLDKWLPGSRFAATIGRIIDSGQGSVVDLEPLDRDDTRALIASDLPGRPDDRLAAYVYSQSRGNPLFTRQALRSLRELRAIRTEHGRCYLVGNPAAGALSRRAALLHRVFQQDRAGRELARAMSAFRRVHLDQIDALEAATGMDRDAIERAFDALIRASIIAPASAGCYEFAHPLIAEVLYNDLGPLERRRLHKLIAEVLGNRQLTAEPDVLEWTTHVAEAATPGDPAAIAAVVEAARLTRNTAPLSAATWYQRALDLLPPESPDRGDLLSRQAIALWKGSRPEAAIEVGGRALSAQGSGDLRTRTLATVINATYAMGRYHDALELVSTHLHNVRSPAPFLAQRALLLAHTGQGERAAVQLDQAQATTDLVAGDQVVTCSYVGHVSNCLGDFARARAAIDRLVALGQGDEPGLAHGARLSALESAAYLLAVTGCLASARGLLARVTQLLPETGWQDVGGQYIYTKAKVEHMTGAWAEALETIRSGAINLEFAGLRNNLAWLRLLEVEILTDQASLDEAAQILDEPLLDADCKLYQVLHGCRAARITAALGNLATARKMLLDQLSLAEQGGLAEARRRCLELLVDVSAAAGDRTAATEYARQLRQLAVRTGIPATITAADLADLAVGNVTEGDRLVCEYENEGRGFVAGQAHLYLATSGVQPDQHLRRALELFTAVGAQLWIPRVLAQAKLIGLNVTTSRKHRDRAAGRTSLSETEVQLVQLLRQGLTNRQISSVLHYSAKTIEVYVSRLYQKVGCRSRLELVLAAERGEIDGLPAGGAEPAEDNRPVPQQLSR